MTSTIATTGSDTPNDSGDTPELVVPEGHVKLTIDGVDVVAPKGELLIRSAERIGNAIPRFCDHPLLKPVGACRQCLVEVEMGGRPMPKPQAACTQEVAEGMVVRTQVTSAVAEKAQRGNLEFLLLNHPLDCPVCDKGGECPLQNQTMANGAGYSRLVDAKRIFVKPLAISTQILLDRERCVLCQRCTRFSDQIAGDKFIDLLERGSSQQIGISAEQPFQSYFSGNTIQICPVGALTSTAYRFRSRPFDLVSTPGVCEHCAGGCALRVDHRRGEVTRRLAGDDPAVNEEWNCDKGRFAFTYVTQDDRLTKPLVRGADGVLAPASWTEAMAAAAAGLAAARDNGGAAVLTGGRLTVSDAYAYAKFARLALRTNDIDFRTRAGSAEEDQFLARHVVGQDVQSGGVTYTELEGAKTILLVGLEPEEEVGIVFLRLRKAWRNHGTRIHSVAAYASRGLEKVGGTLIPAEPGSEPGVVQALANEPLGESLRAGSSVILVGERAAQVPGLLAAVSELAEGTSARIAWIPRRAGDRGALEVGAIGSLLPGGRSVNDDSARLEVESAWGASIPATPGRNTGEIIAAAADGTLSGLVVAGVELADLPQPELAAQALAKVGFLVSLEIRRSAITELADVVFPVAASVEKAGAYRNWEGRDRPFDSTITGKGTLPDARVLDTLGVEMDVDLFTQSVPAATAELNRLGRGQSPRPAVQGTSSASPTTTGRFRLATWRMNLDGGPMQDGEPHLAGTARADVVRISAAAAQELQVGEADLVTVSTAAGQVTLPVAITAIADNVVWLPSRIDQVLLSSSLQAGHGDEVELSAITKGAH